MPIIFLPPAALLAAAAQGAYGSPPDGSGSGANGNSQLWFAISGGRNGVADPNWGGCDIYLSFDNTTYGKPIGTIQGPSRQGVLTAPLASYGGANPDTGDTLAVDLAMSDRALPTASDADGAASRSLCYVDGELIAYGGIAPVGTTGYHLTDLYRGLFGTTAGAHLSGTAFAFLGDLLFKCNLPAEYVGQPLYFKFRSFNIYGNGLADLSGLTPVTFTPGSAPNANVASVPLAGGTMTGSLTTPGLTVGGVTFPGIYTTSSLPAAAGNTHGLAAVTNPSGGKSNLVFSDGTHWLYMDGSVAV